MKKYFLDPFSRQLPSPGYLFANLDDINARTTCKPDPANSFCIFSYSTNHTPTIKVAAWNDEFDKYGKAAVFEHITKLIATKYDELITRRYFGMDSNRLQKFIDGVRLVGGSAHMTLDRVGTTEMQITIPDPFHSMDRILASMNCGTPPKPVILLPGISDIQFYNDRITVVRFVDGSFTKCVADVDEEGKSCFDPYTGVAFCLFKRMLGKDDGHKMFNNLMRKAMGVIRAKKKALEEQEKMKVERLRKEIKRNSKKAQRAAKDREAFIEDIAEAVRRANAKEVDK